MSSLDAKPRCQQEKVNLGRISAAGEIQSQRDVKTSDGASDQVKFASTDTWQVATAMRLELALDQGEHDTGLGGGPFTFSPFIV